MSVTTGGFMKCIPICTSCEGFVRRFNVAYHNGCSAVPDVPPILADFNQFTECLLIRTTLSGRAVAAASLVIDIELVFELRMVLGWQICSI